MSPPPPPPPAPAPKVRKPNPPSYYGNNYNNYQNNPYNQQSSDSALSVTCPYYGCYKVMDAGEFVIHATTLHSGEASHSYSCPICLLEGYNYVVKKRYKSSRTLARNSCRIGFLL